MGRKVPEQFFDKFHTVQRNSVWMNEMLPTLLDLLQMFAEYVQVRSTCYIKAFVTLWLMHSRTWGK